MTINFEFAAIILSHKHYTIKMIEQSATQISMTKFIQNYRFQNELVM
jgi:hypothetical protein